MTAKNTTKFWPHNLELFPLLWRQMLEDKERTGF